MWIWGRLICNEHGASREPFSSIYIYTYVQYTPEYSISLQYLSTKFSSNLLNLVLLRIRSIAKFTRVEFLKFFEVWQFTLLCDSLPHLCVSLPIVRQFTLETLEKRPGFLYHVP